jgi:fructose-1-phosphate kinase PfkB-like protein
VETSSESRICQTILDEGAYDFTEVVENADLPSPAEFDELLRVFSAIESDFDFIIFSGTLPPDAPVDIYARLLALTDARKVLLDTSGDALLTALKKSPALVKINDSEMKLTMGRQGSVRELAPELMRLGAGCVGITRGGDSALLVNSDSAVSFEIPEVDVVSTLGCGDSVNAGICIGLSHGYSMEKAFMYGLACGSANAQAPLPGEVDPELAEHLFRLISCESQ